MTGTKIWHLCILFLLTSDIVISLTSHSQRTRSADVSSLHLATNSMTFMSNIDRFEKGAAILLLRDGNELLIPRYLLPDNCVEGEVCLVTVEKKSERKAIQKQHIEQLQELNKQRIHRPLPSIQTTSQAVEIPAQ